MSQQYCSIASLSAIDSELANGSLFSLERWRMLKILIARYLSCFIYFPPRLLCLPLYNYGHNRKNLQQKEINEYSRIPIAFLHSLYLNVSVLRAVGNLYYLLCILIFTYPKKKYLLNNILCWSWAPFFTSNLDRC